MPAMTSMQRVLTTLSHREPDRVPFFLSLTTQGARELGIGIREYFARPELVAEGQLRLWRKYRHDCLYGFFYASLEIEAWGGETVFSADAPPNAGAPCITNLDRIARLAPPRIKDCASLQKVLAAQRLMKERSGGEVPIIGTVMSPFSLPAMQLGFDHYLELIYDRPELFRELMRINGEFCVEWANAQLEAGANLICYFDPVSSPEITPKTDYSLTGGALARGTLSRIKGPTVTHLGSGRCFGIIDQLARTGTHAIGVSCSEDLADLKRACRGRLGLIGNLNGVAMRTLSPEQAAQHVRQAISAAAKGGGFILSDSHGEIPWQVPDDVLFAISKEVRVSGRYPLSPAREC